MLNNMRAEKAGIFNWMLEGLTRLISQDGFTHSATLHMYTQEYRGMNESFPSLRN